MKEVQVMKKTVWALTAFFYSTAFAHVKWFSKAPFEIPPQNFEQLNHSMFWGLFILSVVTLAALVWLDRKLEKWPRYTHLNEYFDQYTDRATLILRIFTGASLLLNWQADAMIAPELRITSPGLGWFEFALTLLLLFRRTTPAAGLGMILLYVLGIYQHGLFHLLDYIVYLGVGVFLLLCNSRSPRVKDLRIPALYSSLGFSLCWVALEKIFYPTWGLDVLRQAPGLAMGLPHEFFLMSCAFVEFCLGYLLIICLLQRPLALTITIVFFLTTSFFGKMEIVGHTLIHGALLVFVVVGQKGTYRPPIAFHKNLGMRMLFASVNFAILLALMAIPYWYLSQRAYRNHTLAPSPVIETEHEH